MTGLLGLPLPDALSALRAAGLPEPDVERALPHKTPPEGEGIWRVVRVKDNGRRLTVCLFAPSRVRCG